jgi:hypothetical protein
VSDEPEAPAVVPVDDDDDSDEQPARRSDRDRGPSKVPCPACGSRWVRSGPWPWYLGTVGALVCKAVECQECGHQFDLYKPQADLAKRKLHLALAINGVGLIGIILILGGLFVWLRMAMPP